MVNLRASLRYQRTIGLLLVAALLYVGTAPFHYHLHYAPDAHEALVDMHFDTNTGEDEHHDHAVVVDSSADGLVKGKGLSWAPLVAVLIVWLGVALLRSQPLRWRRGPGGAVLRRLRLFAYSLSQRAPPAIP